MFLIAVAQMRPIFLASYSLTLHLAPSPQHMKFANATILYHSPMKKKGSTLAGVPRRSGEDRSPVGNGASSQNNQVSQAFIAVSIHSPCKEAPSISSPSRCILVLVSVFDGIKSLNPSGPM
jgi:hypothetical protein